MIFYFTGTGNSLHAAKTLALSTGDPVCSIAQELNAENRSYAGERIGIVSPVYGYDLPSLVKDFIKGSSFDTDYFYFVLTYGARHGNAVENACDLASSCGLETAFARTVEMPDNWLPGYDMDEQKALDKHEDQSLAEIGGQIAEKTRFVEQVTAEDRGLHEKLRETGFSFVPEHLGDFLNIEDNCTGCKVCTMVCPSGCIEMRDGKAVRDTLAGHGCTGCLACIHACAFHAISLSMPEKNPESRYRNKNVAMAEIVRANWQR